MSKEPSDKYQILLRGGAYQESNDTLENWLDFLTNPDNLQPGLPILTLDCFSRNHGWGAYYAQVSFDETKASLKSLVVKLQCSFKDGIKIYQETDPKAIEAKSAPSIYLSANPHHLRDWIFNLFLNSELEHLDVSFLNEELPDLFDHLPKLKTVYLKNSKLLRLPPSFFRLSELENLDLTACSITEVPSELGKVQSLQNLTFSQPCASSVLRKLRGLTSLTCLCPGYNIPADITQLTKLKYLNFSDVASAPDNFLDFPKLNYLYFHVTDNTAPFKFNEVNVPALKELNTNYPAAFVTSISRFQHLEHFFAGGKPLTKPESISLTTSLQQLNTLTHIALSGLGITGIEFCLSLLNLKWLDLSNNAIVQLPTGLSKLRDLRFIDLSKNGIVHLPADLNNLYQSGFLHLEDNPIVSFPDLNLRNKAKQKIIREGGVYALTVEKDETLLEWLTFLTNPQHLQPGLPELTILLDGYPSGSSINVSFDKNKTSLRSLKLKLSDFITEKTNLFQNTDPQAEDTLSAESESSNPQRLREWIFNLFLHTGLEELQVPFRNTELPDRFATLTQLRCIDFSRSKLTRLPPSICQLHALEILRLNDTPLSELPQHFNQLKNLVSINLSRTSLTQLPAGFFPQQYLESLYLEGTSIVELPDHMDTLTRLKSLTLHTSKLAQLPPGFFQLQSLENLFLEGTSITELPDRFGTLNKLKNVSLNIAELTQLPPSFFQLHVLENLNLEGTSITELPDLFDTLTNLKSISLSNSTIKQLPPSFFQLQTLENLYLQSTSMTELPNHFATLTRLKKISLSGTGITRLPDSFFQLPALEWLDLMDSSLSEIPPDLGKLRTLRYLSCSQPCAPAAWTGLSELTELHCYCPDFHVPAEFSQLIKLKKLNLSSVSSATYESMNLPELEMLRFKRSKSYSPFRLEGNLPSLNELTTDYIETFYPSLKEGVLSRRKVRIIT